MDRPLFLLSAVKNIVLEDQIASVHCKNNLKIHAKMTSFEANLLLNLHRFCFVYYAVNLCAYVYFYFYSPLYTRGTIIRRPSHCDITVCKACYHSHYPLPHPRLHRRCPQVIPLFGGGSTCSANSKLLHRWGYCIFKAYKRTLTYRKVCCIGCKYLYVMVYLLE